MASSEDLSIDKDLYIDKSEMDSLQKFAVSLYPDQVEAALAHLLREEQEKGGETDPLDDIGFDAVDYINQEFPDEGAFSSNLDTFIAKLESKVKQSEHSMYQAIRLQATNSHSAVNDIFESKSAINQLNEKIKGIHDKTKQSEVMVQEICRDIEKLDCAKRNLTLTITSMKRLHMFVTAVDQLEYMAEKRSYKQVANLLQAIVQLEVYFTDYAVIPKIKQLCLNVSVTKDTLTKQIFEDFESISEISSDYYGMENSEQEVSQYYVSSTQTPEALSGACCVIDALGADVRRKLIHSLCDIWLRQYEKIFGTGSSEAALTNTKRRYIWFIRTLREHEDKYGPIFPSFWLIGYHLLSRFCDKTSTHLKSELRKIDPPESVDVGELMRALGSTLDFEQQMAERYQDSLKEDLPVEESKSHSDHTHSETNKNAPVDPDEEEVEAFKAQAKADARDLPPIKASISSVFEPYLVAYVKRESVGIQEQLTKVLNEERVDKNGSLPVLSSAMNLFLYIKNSITRCTKFTTGQAFYDLHREFKTCLSKYSRDLDSKLSDDQSNLGSTKLSSSAKRPSFDVEAATTVCFVLNSAEYCADTVSQLEDMIKGTIDPAYADSISLEEVQDLFYSNVAKSVQTLVRNIEAETLPHLQTLKATDWLSFDEVGDQSLYLSNIVGVVKLHFPSIRDLLSDIYFRTFCDKFIFSFLPKYMQCILSCGRIGEFGAQQLLLDTRALKTTLLRMATFETDAIDTYQKFVNSEMEKCEVLLKLVSMSKGTDVELLLENFQVLWKQGTTSDLKQVLSLRGMSNSDQAKVIKQAKESGVAEADSPSINAEAASQATAQQAQSARANKFDFFNSMKGFSADMTSVIGSTSSSFQTSYKRAVTKK